MKTKFFITLILLHLNLTVNAQIFDAIKNAVGSVASLTVKTITAPTQVVINSAKAATGSGSVSDIYKPIQDIASQTGSTSVQVTQVLSEPQRFFMQKAQEFSQSVGGDAGAFIFDVGTFSNRYYSELANAGVNNINGVLQGQNPFQISAIPLSAAIRAAKERQQNTKPIPEDVKNALRPFFSERTLNNARYAVGKIEITLPNFIGQGHKFMKQDYAVTIDNIIVFNTEPGTYAQNASWWAHEITHVNQYERLGIETFAYTYLRDFGKSLENEAKDNARRITGQTGNSASSSNQLGSFDMSSSNIDQNKDFAQTPEIYISQCIFYNDQFGAMYLVTNYGRIIAVDPRSGQWLHIGYSTPPRRPDVAWSYDLPNANWSYAVGFDGNIYNIITTIKFGQPYTQSYNVGYVRKL